VVVPDDQLSLSIGKKGRNARLASKLVGWKVDIKSHSEIVKETERQKEQERRQLSSLLSLPGVGEKMAERLAAAGFRSLGKIAHASADLLQEVKGVGEKTAQKLIVAAQELLTSGEARAEGEGKIVEAGR
jgi:N utilization substance protein A